MFLKWFVVVMLGVKIYRCFQPLMLCMSPSHTCMIIDDLSNEYNVPVLQWSNTLKQIFKVRYSDVLKMH